MKGEAFPLSFRRIKDKDKKDKKKKKERKKDEVRNSQGNGEMREKGIESFK